MEKYDFSFESFLEAYNGYFFEKENFYIEGKTKEETNEIIVNFGNTWIESFITKETADYEYKKAFSNDGKIIYNYLLFVLDNEKIGTEKVIKNIKTSIFNKKEYRKILKNLLKDEFNRANANLYFSNYNKAKRNEIKEKEKQLYKSYFKKEL